MAGPSQPEPRGLGPIALVRWAWRAWREARRLGLVRLDPAARTRRWWAGPAMGLAGFLLPIIYITLPYGLFLHSQLHFLGVLGLSSGWTLLHFLIPGFACVLGARAFLLEQRTGTMDALRMTPLPREVLVIMRFGQALGPVLWALAGLLPGCFVLPAILARNAGTSTGLASFLGLAAWLAQALFSFAACAAGVCGSARCGGLVRALVWACAYVALDLLALGFGAVLVIVGLGSLTGLDAHVLVGLFFLVAGVLEGAGALVLLPLYALHNAAHHFDAWAGAAEGE